MKRRVDPLARPVEHLDGLLKYLLRSVIVVSVGQVSQAAVSDCRHSWRVCSG